MRPIRGSRFRTVAAKLRNLVPWARPEEDMDDEIHIETRIANESRPALRPLVHVHELREGGAVMSDENLTVAAALVDHAPVVGRAFAYRFDARDRSIGVSGDTAPSDNLVKLAAGSHVLVSLVRSANGLALSRPCSAAHASQALGATRGTPPA
jgi:ribonuclease BN (tRNA processing enzyme)